MNKLAKPPAAAAEDRVNVVIRVTPDQRRRLRALALANDTTMQAMVEQALQRMIKGAR